MVHLYLQYIRNRIEEEEEEEEGNYNLQEVKSGISRKRRKA